VTLKDGTYLPRLTVLVEKLRVLHPVQKFPAFYGTRVFIIAFTKAIPRATT